MNSANGSNVKNIAVIAFVSVLLFGIFYYLITDVTSTPSSNLKAESQKVVEDSAKQAYLAESSATKGDSDEKSQDTIKNHEEVKTTTEVKDQTEASEVKGDKAEVSVFKALSSQKADSQAKVVLGGADEQTPESTVPDTGTNTIFGAFVMSSLIMFAGIYMLMTQPKDVALAKFEKRIIRELD